MKKVIALLNHEAVKNYCRLVMIIFLISFCIKICEAFFIFSNHFFSNDYFIWQLHGFWDDLAFISKYSLIIFPFYALIFWWKKSIANGILIFLFGTYFILNVLLIYYFNESLTPLTVNNLTGMSGEQVAIILEIYGFKKIQLLFLIPAYVVLYIIFWSLRNRFEKPVLILSITIIAITSVIIDLIFPAQIKNFDSELNYQIVVNKVKYLKESYDKFRTQKISYSDDEIDNELNYFYQINNVSEKTYFKYPFFSPKQIRNPLSNFFPKKDTTPNVVFIICESLGKQFSGPEARLGSFTPFLDSLEKQSLYWTNFMANAERTFGALPNLLAGVPEGENGFLNLKSKMPDHLSLPLLLKENSKYQTGFFCGANQEFDHMESYLLFQKFDYIFGKSTFSQNSNKKEITDKNGKPKLFNWGAEDDIVFKESFDLMDSIYSNGPYCNVYLTTSFHEPYAYTNEQKFIQNAKNQINKINPKNKASYIEEIKHFAAIMYMDYSLKNFFDAYSKRQDFENTIFIICGDHSIKFMSDHSRIEKYHVPLLIYSPMLTRSKRIKSMACHKDIPAALQGLLKNNFGVEMPNFSISQSDNLDTLSTFNVGSANHVLMYADKRMENYIWKNYFYADGALFQLKDNLKLERIENDNILSEISARLSNYKILSQHMCNTNHYLPDSIYSKFANHRNLFQLTHQFDEGNIDQQKYFKSESLTNSEHYSGQFSVSNNKEHYLYFIQNLAFDFAQPLRVKIKFVIKSSSNVYPALYAVRRKVSEDQKTQMDLTTNTIYLDSDKAYFKETKKDGWFNFEGCFWLKEIYNSSPKQSLNLFLFSDHEINYYIDNLEIEIREF